jgi:hypothetical protein
MTLAIFYDFGSQVTATHPLRFPPRDYHALLIGISIIQQLFGAKKSVQGGNAYLEFRNA